MPPPDLSAPPFLCPCLGFTEADVARALAEGAASVGQVFRRLGAIPKCGGCVGVVRDRLRAAQASAE
jgi:bacterioferritin-associated ferredoxin